MVSVSEVLRRNITKHCPPLDAQQAGIMYDEAVASGKARYPFTKRSPPISASDLAAIKADFEAEGYGNNW